MISNEESGVVSYYEGERLPPCWEPKRVSLHRLRWFRLKTSCQAIIFIVIPDHVLDLSFIRDLVKETYAAKGRPSIDPVVFWHRCTS